MPNLICPNCGKQLFHENETTLNIEMTVHSKFCRKKEGETQSYMHRSPTEKEAMDAERALDEDERSILQR